MNNGDNPYHRYNSYIYEVRKQKYEEYKKNPK